MPIQKYGKCYIQATAPLKTPLPISGMVKVKPIRYVQEKYNLSCYKHDMYRRNITYPVINIYNYMTMKVIVLESITLNPNQLWKQHYYQYQWY